MTPSQKCTHIHRVSKKQDWNTKLISITWSVLNGFAKFFHWHTLHRIKEHNNHYRSHHTQNMSLHYPSQNRSRKQYPNFSIQLYAASNNRERTLRLTSSLVQRIQLCICHCVQPRSPLASLRDSELCSPDCSAAGIDLLHRDQTGCRRLVCWETGRSVAEGPTIATRTSNLHAQRQRNM